MQIESDARQLGRFTPFNIQAVYGGIDYAKQRETLAAGCDVLVGTPGRLIDYLKQHVWTPRKVEVLVIDEADRMFDMGFIADLRFILRRLPPPERRQSFLFSATLSFRVLELTWEFMNNPSADHDHARSRRRPSGWSSCSTTSAARRSSALLLGLLRREGGDRILIFANTREEARRLEDRLTRNGWDARALTGDVDQKRRLRILNDFKEGQLPVLVATDVASRGLHIEAVTHVVNWDLPQDPEDYVHRIGRTARAGAGGKAIAPRGRGQRALNLEGIEKFIGQKILVEWPEDDLIVPEIKPTAEERRRYAEERRARLEARRGRDDRGGGRPRRPWRGRAAAAVAIAAGRRSPVGRRAAAARPRRPRHRPRPRRRRAAASRRRRASAPPPAWPPGRRARRGRQRPAAAPRRPEPHSLAPRLRHKPACSGE